MPRRSNLTLLALALAAHAQAQPQIPSEFDAPGQALARLFTLGGVASFQAAQDPQTINTGGSMRLDIAYTTSGIFSFSTAALGVFNTGTAGFNTSPAADTFSITVLAPEPLPGGLELLVTLRDDDNDDATILTGDDDDEWAAPAIPIAPGLGIYNVPLAALEDINPGVGNDTMDFPSGPVGGMILAFQTSTTLPGGRIVTPIVLFIDHAGAYLGEQILPGPSCPADVNGDGMLLPNDFSAWIQAFNAMTPGCDQNRDGACLPNDFSAWIANFNAGC